MISCAGRLREPERALLLCSGFSTHFQRPPDAEIDLNQFPPEKACALFLSDVNPRIAYGAWSAKNKYLDLSKKASEQAEKAKDATRSASELSLA